MRIFRQHFPGGNFYPPRVVTKDSRYIVGSVAGSGGSFSGTEIERGGRKVLILSSSLRDFFQPTGFYVEHRPLAMFYGPTHKDTPRIYSMHMFLRRPLLKRCAIVHRNIEGNLIPRHEEREEPAVCVVLATVWKEEHRKQVGEE